MLSYGSTTQQLSPAFPMKNLLIRLSLLLGLLASVFANEFTVKSFAPIANDLAARRFERIDVNDIPCAIIKIRTDIPQPFVFDANLGIEGDVEYKDNNEIWVYVSDGERQLTIARDGFITLHYPLPMSINKSMVYSLVLTAKEHKLSVVIISDPPDAEKFIDGKSMGTGNSFEIEMGQRQLELRKTGFHTYTENIVIDEQHKLFQIPQLTEIEPVMVTLKSQPAGADIFINNVLEGKTNKQLFKFPGEYSLRISKSNFETIDKSVQVTDSGDNSWTFKLVKSTAILTIKTTPADAEIFINGDHKSIKTLELAPGRYRIEVKQAGWEAANRTITLVKGQDQTQSFLLIRKTGKLQLVVEPMEARVVLKQGSRTIDSWAGSKYKKGLPVGDYSLQFSLTGYQAETRTIAIAENKTSTLDISLKQQPVAGSSNRPGSQGTMLTDIDGNTYQTVQIGNQTWMAENLRVTHYRDGTAIPNVTDNTAWENLSTGAYCYYDNYSSNGDIYGALYNWFAVANDHNIAPEGWHVPTDAEWKTLEMAWISQSEADDVRGSGTNKGSKLAGNAELWRNGALESNSEFGTSGFRALPGGYRHCSYGGYGSMGDYGYFWSATEYSSTTAWYRSLGYGSSAVTRGSTNKSYGFSIRLVRD